MLRGRFINGADQPAIGDCQEEIGERGGELWLQGHSELC